MKPSPKLFATTSQIRALVGGALVLGLAACAGGGGGAGPSQKPPASNASASSGGSGSAASSGAIQGPANDRFQQALALMRDHKADEAQTALEALVKDFPNYSGPQTDLGILYARAKQRDKAFSSFNKAIAANPKNATAYDWEGIIYRESGDYTNAEQSYLKAVAAQPDYSSAHLNLAVLYDTYLRRPQDAVTQYREYQRLSGASKPIVTAWINELQPPAAAPAPATAASPVVGSSPAPASAPLAPAPAAASSSSRTQPTVVVAPSRSSTP